MVNKEKVIEGLELCKNGSCDVNTECPYKGSFKCIERLCTDALALIKQHEPVKPRSVTRHGPCPQVQHFCGRCNAMLFRRKQKYCSECGQPVKWEQMSNE